MIGWKICSSWRMNCFHGQQLTVVWENERKCVPLVRKLVTLVKICSFFYNWFPLVSVTVSTRRKPLNKKKRFPLAGKSVSTSQNEEFRWNIRFQYLLITLMVSNSSDQKNTVSVGRKSVCISQVKDIKKQASVIRKHGFHFKKMRKSKKIGVH